MTVGQSLAPALGAEYAVERIALPFTGGDFPHAHAHVVPLVEDTDITSGRCIADDGDVRSPGRAARRRRHVGP